MPRRKLKINELSKKEHDSSFLNGLKCKDKQIEMEYFSPVRGVGICKGVGVAFAQLTLLSILIVLCLNYSLVMNVSAV